MPWCVHARRSVADLRQQGIALLLEADRAMAKVTKSTAIAANTVQPWRSSPTMQPKAMHSAPGIRKIDSICRKFTNGVGFSKG
jgi:hypothetical protein